MVQGEDLPVSEDERCPPHSGDLGLEIPLQVGYKSPAVAPLRTQPVSQFRVAVHIEPRRESVIVPIDLQDLAELPALVRILLGVEQDLTDPVNGLGPAQFMAGAVVDQEIAQPCPVEDVVPQ